MNVSYNGWVRVSKGNHCPICGKFDWCLVAKDGSAAICPRTPEGAERDLGEAGYLHRIQPGHRRHRTTRSVDVTCRSDAADPQLMLTVVNSIIVGLRAKDLQLLAQSLGVTSASLKRMRIGWSRKHDAWTFPMHDADGEVIGIRLRTDGGKKVAVSGSHQGLHIPWHLGHPKVLLLTEGPTDCAAMLDLGFAAVGRPSCAGSEDLAVEFVARKSPRLVVVVGDNDPPGHDGRRPGLDGATALASVLALHTRAKILLPPAGIKDAREWKIAGATAADVDAAIQAAPTIAVKISMQRGGGR